MKKKKWLMWLHESWGGEDNKADAVDDGFKLAHSIVELDLNAWLHDRKNKS